MRRTAVVLLCFFIAAAFGCTVEQTTITPPQHETSARPLPFRGKLTNGDPEELPPAVAASLANDSDVTFSYREELTHDEHHLPKAFTALDPVTYIGAPLGDFGVSAFASLSIVKDNRVVGDYTAKAYVSKTYSLYSEPTHRELEDEARAAVRQRIDDKLYHDESRLTQALAETPNSASAPNQ